MTNLPGRDALAGVPATASGRKTASADVTAADGDQAAASQDPAAQAADLLALLGLPVQNPLPAAAANPVVASPSSVDGLTRDQAVAAKLTPAPNAVADAGSSGVTSAHVSSSASARADAAASPTLTDLLKPGVNAPPPQALATAVASLSDAAPRRAASTDSSPAAGSAASMTLTPLGSAAAVAASATTPVATQSTPAPTATVTVQLPGHVLNDPGWSDGFRERVALLASQGVQHASIRVTPEGMGPIQVHIAMADQGAQVEFKAQHHATAALIESMLPRLAHAMESQGIKLDDARVSAFTRQDEAALQSSLQQDGRQAASQQTGNGERRFAATLGEAGGDTRDSVSVAPVAPRRSPSAGKLDAYA